jgi:hypothetical protein
MKMQTPNNQPPWTPQPSDQSSQRSTQEQQSYWQVPQYDQQAQTFTQWPPSYQQYTQYPPQSQQPSSQQLYQPPYMQPGQYQQVPQWHQPYGQSPPEWQPQPPKKSRKGTWIALYIVLALIVFGCAAMYGVANSNKNNIATSTNTQQTQATSASATPTQPPTPTPTLSPTQVENAYKATTTTTTINNLDKDGNQDKGKNVHFTCKILNFVKDDNGNTAGANVDAPDSYSASVIQIAFPSGTDITQLNQGDILEVWGTDEGVFSGQNAFGATIQEVGIAAQYLTDRTTNYQTS